MSLEASETTSAAATYPAAVLQWRKIEGEDHTPALREAMAAGGPVTLRNVEHIARVRRVVTEGVFTVCMCGAAMKSEPYLAYSRRVFVPTARRVHRGTSSMLFAATKFPYIAAAKEDEIRAAQKSINAMWLGVIQHTGDWEEGLAPPPYFADMVIMHPGTPEGRWSWFSVGDDGEAATGVRHLLERIRERTTDAALSALTMDDLVKLHTAQG